MAVISIKGRDYTPITVKDSSDRRAQQYANTISSALRKLGLGENDIDLTVERAAFRKLPASATWFMDGHKLHYSWSSQNSYAENLYIVSKVIETEVNAVLDESVPIEDFVRKFIDTEEDLAAARIKAREDLGLAPDEKDLEVINRAFKDLARVHHPDKHGGDIAEFKRINNAHKALKRELG